MIIKKIRSFIKKTLFNMLTLWNYFKIYLLEENVTLGKNVVIGRGVIIKTTDGGKVTISDNVSIESNCYIYAQCGEITIGTNTFIGSGSQIVAKKSIVIGSGNLISAYCIIRDGNHGIKRGININTQPHDIEEISIGDDVWLGSHCVVTAGNTIETGAVVGANAVVTKDVEAYSIVGGVPAMFINQRI
jgi:acetyltransferase-like isoleucine patch superfamily enzyme